MTPELILHRIRTEYREMPGLCLTPPQVRRLWQLDATTCETALARLLDEHFLSRTRDGSYVLFPGTRVCGRRRPTARRSGTEQASSDRRGCRRPQPCRCRLRSCARKAIVTVHTAPMRDHG